MVFLGRPTPALNPARATAAGASDTATRAAAGGLRMLLPRIAQPKRAGPPLSPLELPLAAMTAPRAARPRRARARARGAVGASGRLGGGGREAERGTRGRAGQGTVRE